MDEQEIIKEAQEKAQRYPRIVEMVYYPEGFVPNSYRYRAPGVRYRVNIASGTIKPEQYDKKRPYGKGPLWVAVSAKGGYLRI